MPPVAKHVREDPAAGGAPFQLLVLFVFLTAAITLVAWRYYLAQKDAVAREVQSQLPAIAILLSAAAISLILAAGAGVFLLWRRQQLRFYRAGYEAEIQRQALVGHYDYLSRFANDIILMMDASGRIIEANDRAVTTYGYSREELQAMTIRDLRHASDLPSFEREWKEAEERGSLVFETVQRDRAGRPIPVEISVRFIDVGGTRFRQSIIRDITERRAMDEKMRRMLDTLSAILEASPAAIVSLSPDSQVTTWNKAAERMFGWTAEEAIGIFPPFIPDDRKEKAARVHERVKQGEVISAMRAKGQCKDGRRITMSLSAAPLHDPEGRCAGIALNLLDVTEHMEAEEALRHSEERFRSVVEHAPQAIVVECELRILYVNSAAVKMFGAESAAQLVGRNALELISPEDRGPAAERSARVASGIPVSAMERTYLRLDGQSLAVEVSGAPVRYDRKPSSLVFLRDITERRRTETEKARLEEQLRHAQKMESLGRLAGGVAHDFNNHLTVIAGYCDMLLSHFGSEDPLREELEEIRDAGERAAALTQQLLAFSRKQIAERTAVSLNEVVSESGKMLRRLIGENIEIIANLEPAIGLVIADRGQMNQVVMNLAINARDAMPSGGKLVIATANVDLDADSVAQFKDLAPGPFVELSVSDTGVGMNEETLQHAFEPFFTTKGMGIGTGLGLSTVYGIVQQSQGGIRVSSQPGRGSLFQILLPRAPHGAELPAQPIHETELPRGNETVLVVEDQPEVRRLALRILKRNGYRLLEASNGPEALALSQNHSGKIHLLLTDVVMPGMTGRELADRLQALRPEIKVLYTSGYTADVIGHEGLIDPGMAYLPKPFTPAQLSLKTREVLGQSKALGRILIIDDDDPVRGLLQQIVADAGYEVVAAADGKSGVRLMEQNPFDLVLTDLIMPDQEGIETIRVLRRGYPAIRIIAMSGAFDGVYLKTAGMLGAQATLRKPIDPEELLRTIRDLLT